jgi:hypothetical protein
MGESDRPDDDAAVTHIRSPFTGGADLAPDEVLTATRLVRAVVDSRIRSRSMIVEPGVRLRHAGTDRFGEPDTGLEQADVYLEILDGSHAGTMVVLWTFDAQPVDVPALIALDHGLTSV